MLPRSRSFPQHPVQAAGKGAKQSQRPEGTVPPGPRRLLKHPRKPSCLQPSCSESSSSLGHWPKMPISSIRSWSSTTDHTNHHHHLPPRWYVPREQLPRSLLFPRQVHPLYHDLLFHGLPFRNSRASAVCRILSRPEDLHDEVRDKEDFSAPGPYLWMASHQGPLRFQHRFVMSYDPSRHAFTSAPLDAVEEP